MWKASAGRNVSVTKSNDDDDWSTDPDFVNDVSEKEQRWGAKTIEGSGHVASLSMNQLRQDVSKEDMEAKKKQLAIGPKPSHGYGGKFGVEKDRMDKSAVGMDYKADLSQHSSQTDAAKGFGGKFGIQVDRKDSAAEGWDYQGKVEKHASQKDYSVGFGGKYGIQADRVDKSAKGWSEQSKPELHPSQTDHKVGFGGKFGVQADRVDKSAKDWNEKTAAELHPSQVDHKVGFGGKFGVQSDRVDKSAKGWSEQTKPDLHSSQTDHNKGFGGKFGVETNTDKAALGYDSGSHIVGTNYEPTRGQVSGSSEGAKNLKAKFEMMSSANDADAKINDQREKRKMNEMREKKEEQEKIINTDTPIEADTDANDSRLSHVQYSETIKTPKVSSTDDTQEDVASNNHLNKDQDVEEDDNLYQDANSVVGCNQINETVGDNYYEDAGTAIAHAEEAADDYYQDVGSVMTASSSQNLAVALYDYQAADDDELTFDPGEEITEIEFIDEGWWKGCCRGKMGLFPSNYVELKK